MCAQVWDVCQELPVFVWAPLSKKTKNIPAVQKEKTSLPALRFAHTSNVRKVTPLERTRCCFLKNIDMLDMEISCCCCWRAIVSLSLASKASSAILFCILKMKYADVDTFLWNPPQMHCYELSPDYKLHRGLLTGKTKPIWMWQEQNENRERKNMTIIAYKSSNYHK